MSVSLAATTGVFYWAVEHVTAVLQVEITGVNLAQSKLENTSGSIRGTKLSLV